MTSELGNSPQQVSGLAPLKRKSEKKKTSWPPGIYMALGLMIIVAGTALGLAFGGRLPRFIYLIGLAFFLYGAIFFTARIIHSVWLEGKNR